MKTSIIIPLISAGVIAMLVSAEPPQEPAGSDRGLPSSPKKIVEHFEISPTGHQVVKLSVESEPLRLLIDTGSGGDFLDSSVVERLKLKAKDDSVGSSSGVGGQGGPIRALNSIECEIDDHRIKIEFSAMDLSPVKSAGGDGGFDGILGSPFLRARHAILDFGSNTLTFDADPF
jgi:hypothetical protein